MEFTSKREYTVEIPRDEFEYIIREWLKTKKIFPLSQSALRIHAGYENPHNWFVYWEERE